MQKGGKSCIGHESPIVSPGRNKSGLVVFFYFSFAVCLFKGYQSVWLLAARFTCCIIDWVMVVMGLCHTVNIVLLIFAWLAVRVSDKKCATQNSFLAKHILRIMLLKIQIFSRLPKSVPGTQAKDWKMKNQAFFSYILLHNNQVFCSI